MFQVTKLPSSNPPFLVSLADGRRHSNPMAHTNTHTLTNVWPTNFIFPKQSFGAEKVAKNIFGQSKLWVKKNATKKNATKKKLD